jgi:hypothetical protein
MPDRTSKPKRPRDPNQLAKLVVDLATGRASETAPRKKNPAAVALGRLGGAKGGDARAKSLTAKRRTEIAKKAATARWKKPTP